MIENDAKIEIENKPPEKPEDKPDDKDEDSVGDVIKKVLCCGKPCKKLP